MTYDETKAYCLQHVMVSQLSSPSKALVQWAASANQLATHFGHGKRRWKHESIKLDQNGILK